MLPREKSTEREKSFILPLYKEDQNILVERMRLKKRVVVGGLVLAAVGAGLVLGWRATAFTSGELSAMQWGKIPNIIAISNAERGGRTGILFIKLKNGEEQFIAGAWKANFTDEGNVFAFGEFPIEYSEQKGQQLYYISNESILDFELQSVPEKITSAQENPKATYMLVETMSDTSSTYCVAELKEGNSPTCNTLNTPGTAKAMWNPDKDHEAIIKNDAGEMFLFDPWEKSPKSVEQADEPDLYAELDEKLQKKTQTRTVTAQGSGDRSLYRIVNVVFIRDEWGWSFARIPAFASAAWLSDGKHLLIKQKDVISVLEIESKTLARAVADPRIGKRAITFRNAVFDQKL